MSIKSQPEHRNHLGSFVLKTQTCPNIPSPLGRKDGLNDSLVAHLDRDYCRHKCLVPRPSPSSIRPSSLPGQKYCGDGSCDRGWKVTDSHFGCKHSGRCYTEMTRRTKHKDHGPEPRADERRRAPAARTTSTTRRLRLGLKRGSDGEHEWVPDTD